MSHQGKSNGTKERIKRNHFQLAPRQADLKETKVVINGQEYPAIVTGKSIKRARSGQ